MCQFITLGIREGGVTVLEALGRGREGFGIFPCMNPNVAKLFPVGERLFVVTHGQCSCDLVVADHRVLATDDARHRRRYEEKGWSEAKIDRALAASRSAREPGRTPAPEQRVRFLAALEQQIQLCGRVHLYTHQFRGDFQEEGIPAAARVQMSMSALRNAGGVFPEDALITLTLVPEAG